MKNYPALTFKQPWASLVMSGIKDVENRSWLTGYRGPVFVHAGLKWDPAPPPVYAAGFGPEDLPHGVILGTVDLIMIVDNSASPWARKGDHHWLLSNPRPFATPVPWSGQMGLWWPVKG